MKYLQQIEPGLNAYTVSFDPSLLDTLRKIFDDSLRERFQREGYAYLFSGMEQINIQIKMEDLQFHVTSYGTAPLLWVSNNNAHTYNIFKTFMTELDIMDDIKELVDFENRIEVYCCFFVVGKKMDRETWHKDYFDGANGYTLITPLFELDSSHGNLMYKDKDAGNKIYEYKMNEAIIFGDGFEHATQPYPETETLRVMLSFTFGTDKKEYWDTLKETIGEQSNYMILPCGHEKGTCQCFVEHE
ncbi:MAG TPA: hypothetical protein ENJ87_07840 [Gammaproteobacteria bacterium]|nr:hypothetical protein [Gammaproteobacteria bacterium]